MNNEGDENEFQIPVDEQDVLSKILEDHLKNKIYDDRMSSQIINDILEDVMERLNMLKKPYKYIANCMISQRIGTCMSNYTSGLWDKTTDNVYHFIYPRDKTYTGKDKSLIFGLLTIACISFTSKVN